MVGGRRKDEIMDINRINNTLGKFDHYLLTHKCVVVSVSGGSDSDIIVHMVATYLRCHLPKIHFVFCDTGLEWEATRNHIEELKKQNKKNSTHKTKSKVNKI